MQDYWYDDEEEVVRFERIPRQRKTKEKLRARRTPKLGWADLALQEKEYDVFERER